MGRFRIVVTDQVFPTVDTERTILASIDAELLIADGTPGGVADLARTADGLLTTYYPVDAGLIATLDRCRIIARYGIGVDNIDLAAAKRAGIVVTNVPDYSVEEVAAHALAMILSLVRRLPTADGLVRAGGWGIEGLRPVRRFSELTFGLVGYGRIARRLGTAIAALGGRVIAHDPFVQPGDGLPVLVSLDELTETSDVISIHAPATPDTRGLFDMLRMKRMRPGAILVNTSRGSLVVVPDLVALIRAGHLGGAGLDVFDPEPPNASELADVPNLLLSPHMAYYSEASIAESQHKAAMQVVKVLTGGEPDYRVGVG